MECRVHLLNNERVEPRDNVGTFFTPFSDIESLVSPAADTMKVLLGNMVTGKNFQKH